MTIEEVLSSTLIGVFGAAIPVERIAVLDGVSESEYWLLPSYGVLVDEVEDQEGNRLWRVKSPLTEASTSGEEISYDEYLCQDLSEMLATLAGVVSAIRLVIVAESLGLEVSHEGNG